MNRHFLSFLYFYNLPIIYAKHDNILINITNYIILPVKLLVYTWETF